MLCKLNHRTNSEVVTREKDHLGCQLECALTVDEQMQWAAWGVKLL